jgi:hypothetical protein
METLGEAYRAGWRIELRCQRSSRVGTAKLKPCRHFTTLHLETLVATRGHAFPLSLLQSRLKCPKCGDRHVLVLFHGSTNPSAARAS